MCEHRRARRCLSPEHFLGFKAVQLVTQRPGLGFSSPLIYSKTASVTVAASGSEAHEAGGGVGCVTFSSPCCLFLGGGSDSSTFSHKLLWID